jgi:hypothetical protein
VIGRKAEGLGPERSGEARRGAVAAERIVTESRAESQVGGAADQGAWTSPDRAARARPIPAISSPHVGARTYSSRSATAGAVRPARIAG